MQRFNTMTSTPVAYPKNNLKLPSRKLWTKENINEQNYHDSWSKYQNTDKLKIQEEWDKIQSPQFIDFGSTLNSGDSFFDNSFIVSTPIASVETKKTSTKSENEPLTTSMHNVSLSNVEHEVTQDECTDCYEKNETVIEQYVVHNSSVKDMIKPEKNNKVKKLPNTAVIPFSFDLREKYRQEHKQERTNKEMKEKQKNEIFRAKPVPKFVKLHAVPTRPNEANNPTNQNVNIPEKQVKKKNGEVWKKPPFVPCLPRKNFEKPKTPPLLSAIRAEKRKLFDETVKAKERQREQMKQMEIINKKKEEEEQIARLRKQTVHKAQPIRKYKLGLPKIEKRPVTDPITPISFKRRRRY